MEEQQRNLTDADIQALADAFKSTGHAPCRFSDVDPELMREALTFYKKINSALDDGRNVFIRTLIVLFVSGAVGLVGLGIYTKIKEIGGP